MINYSFIIPHKNSPDFLNRCLNSIPRRDDVEIIVVDDNSNPSIVNWDKFRFDNDKGVQLILDKSNEGAGNARNIGIKNAHGRWLLFPDADDFYVSGFMDVLDKYCSSDIDILYFSFIYTTDKGVGLEHPVVSAIEQYCKDSKNFDYVKYKNYTPWDKMVKASFVNLHHCRYEAVPSGNDMFFSFQIAYFAKKIKVINDKLYNYVKYDHSQTNRNWSDEKVYLSLRRLIRRNSFYRFVGLEKWDYNILLTLFKDLIVSGQRLQALKEIKLYIRNYTKLMKDKNHYIDVINSNKNREIV